MSLSYAVLGFLNRVERDAAQATDPRLLGRLKKMAQDAWDGAQVALHAPMAPRTLEAFTNLPGLMDESNRVDVPFPRPVMIVGIRPSVVRTSAGALVVPTAEDILCSLDVDHGDRPTASEGESTAGGGRFGQYVTLASLAVERRFLGIKLSAAKPTVGLSFRWKRGNSQTAVYEDINLGVAFYYRFL